MNKKDEKSDTSKQVITTKLKEYLDRAEQLKEHLHKSSNEKKPIGATNGDGSGEETGNESKKFKAALEG